MPAALPMIGHAKAGGAGWAIMLADLALILFIVTASYAGGGKSSDASNLDPIPQAIYRASPDAPPIADWIAAQGLGKGARLQITMGYDPAHPETAMSAAASLAAQAVAAGAVPRIVLQPDGGQPSAVLAYDR